MLRIAIVGCGKIADSHVSQIQRIGGSKVIAACDREPLMAQQLCERFNIERSFSELGELLEDARPDVVHVTTPPQSHLVIARTCLLAGCHCYIEKPIALNAAEADEILALARERNVKVTVGHDDQFRHAARRMRTLIGQGYLGGPPLHMESYYCYELNENSSYARALLADPEHWVRKLPGGLLHNVISHGIARIAEYFPTDAVSVTAQGFVSPMLKNLGEHSLIDELRVIMSAECGVTAYFTFSSQMRPSLHQFRVFGSKNALLLDQDNETLIKIPGTKHRSVLEQLVPPLRFAQQYTTNAFGNAAKFLANDLHSKSGMKYLIEAFYQSILSGNKPPIPDREILLTARIMDSIFSQLKRFQSATVKQTVPAIISSFS